VLETHEIEEEDLVYLTKEEREELDKLLTSLPSIENAPRLADFIRDGWHVLEPSTPLVWNWHIDAIADHVEATLTDWIHRKLEPEYRQRIRNLLINIPPGTAKSRIVSVFTPAWMWLLWPSWRCLFLSSNPRVSLRDSLYCRDLIESKWYQDTFQPKWILRDDQDSKSLYWNTFGGTRAAQGILSRITGDRVDALFVDDPHDAEEVKSDAKRLSVLAKWDSSIRNRVSDPETSVRIGIMQRLHEQDWSGHVLAQEKWEHLCIPQEFEPERFTAEKYRIPKTTAIGWSDPRKEHGELLMPRRFPEAVLEQEKLTLGSAGYAGQHQQRPAAAAGNIFKRWWWKFWVPSGTLALYRQIFIQLDDGTQRQCVVEEAPESFDEQLQSWDMAFKDNPQNDHVAGGTWGRKGSRAYLQDFVFAQLSFTNSKEAVRAMTAKHPKAYAKLIEDKANGPAIIDSLKTEISGIIAVNPEGGKLSRGHAVAPFVEAGNVYLPHPDLAIGVGKQCTGIMQMLDQISDFPFATRDDWVDMTTQALLRLLAGQAPAMSGPHATKAPDVASAPAAAPKQGSFDSEGRFIPPRRNR
jgi:predicted phage terminase large subunit-like protein